MSETLNAADTLMPPGFLQDRYRLQDKIGAGGMALVYRAYDETLDRTVAIKFLSPQRVLSADASARFLREARTVARLSHPNIVTLFDVGRVDFWHYLVLEYINGQDLHKLMVQRGGALPLAESLAIIRGVFAALGYAHHNGVIHRDIKPDNIMLTQEGTVKITDFGLALARDETRLTQEGAMMGTLLYMAPEVLLGKDVDHRVDLYGAGVVFYELLVGRPPFVGSDMMNTISQILNHPPPPPHTNHIHIPAAFEQLILKLLAKNPEARYSSATEVLDDLPAFEQKEESDLSAAPLLTELRLYAAQEDTVRALETERRRLAMLLENEIIAPLNLLLSQASIYEQTLAAQPQTRMALSLLVSLTRQVLQQGRDVSANLHPTILETLGFEPALEALVNQIMRASGLKIVLAVERLRERLPLPVELALFRTTQEVLERAVRHARASQVTISLRQTGDSILFKLTDNGLIKTGLEMLQPLRRRIEQLGGHFETSADESQGLDLMISFTYQPIEQLTAREIEIVRLVAQGMTNKQVAAMLQISARTVNFHLNNIFSKLNVNSRTEAAIYALRRGWVDTSTFIT